MFQASRRRTIYGAGAAFIVLLIIVYIVAHSNLLDSGTQKATASIDPKTLVVSAADVDSKFTGEGTPNASLHISVGGGGDVIDESMVTVDQYGKWSVSFHKVADVCRWSGSCSLQVWTKDGSIRLAVGVITTHWATVAQCLSAAKNKYLTAVHFAGGDNCPLDRNGLPDPVCVQQTSEGKSAYQTLSTDQNLCHE